MEEIVEDKPQDAAYLPVADKVERRTHLDPQLTQPSHVITQPSLFPLVSCFHHVRLASVLSVDENHFLTRRLEFA